MTHKKPPLGVKPILFSTPMVQAILNGSKTMTRRVIKPQPSYKDKYYGGWVYETAHATTSMQSINDGVYPDTPPYKQGDILWVRETWADVFGKTEYRADFSDADNEYRTARYGSKIAKWRPSIHMPRKAARIFLRITGVRAERLQSILCGDMRAEGCIPENVTGGQWQQWQYDYWIPLWDSINAERGYGWVSNPWVWVVIFERVKEKDVKHD